MKRRRQICFVADDQDGCGEYAVTVCGLSILNARITRDRNQVTCALCDIQMESEKESADQYESDRDSTPDDDRELIPFLLENL